MRARKREHAVCAAIRRLRSGVLRTAARRWVRVLVRVLVRMLVRVRVQAWAPVMGAGADMGGTIEGTDADAVAAWVVVAARWRGGCRRAGAVMGLVLAPSDVCVGSPALRLGRLVASSPRDASTSLPLLSVLSSLGRKQRWWRCCSQGLRGRVGRSETTGGYVARLWGRGHMLPHFRSAQLTPTAPHRGPRPPRHGADLPGPGFPTRIPEQWNGAGSKVLASLGSVNSTVLRVPLVG